MKIAIFGLARSGLAAFNFLQTKPEIDVYLVNQGEPSTWANYNELKEKIDQAKMLNQDKALNLLAQMDEIILSPGIPRSHAALVKALEVNVPIISEIEFAYRNSSDIPVIGITGTNGKTTTTTMIGELLQKAGKRVFVGGNIGRPYSEILFSRDQYDVAVIELSSFQLESIVTFKPHIALLLNITHNHTERYDKHDDYVKAKYELFKNQKEQDFVLIHPSLTIPKNRAQVATIPALVDFDFSQSHLVGEHNKSNFACAYQVAKWLGIENLASLFQNFINEFSGVEFRLQFIREFQGLKIYNDGKSTNDAATVAAIDAFNPSEPLYLILGGQPRTQSTTLQNSLRGKNLQKVFVFGGAQQLVSEAIKDQFWVECYPDLVTLMKAIKRQNLRGNLVFSPGFPSFDLYKDYVSRGNHFTELVNQL
jgi:UDP-N-acetylmuramoylalanine--D-glutamate ligase